MASRPTTARPHTATTHRDDASYVIAVLEGRGVSREVGLAALDRDTGSVVLVQLSDCPTYVKSLHQMHLHRPAVILIPDTFLSASDASLLPSGKRSATTSLLVELMKEEFPAAVIQPTSRRYWNDTHGFEFVNQLCVQDEERTGTILAVSNKYYALSACAALFKYAEVKLNTRFANGFLRIRYAPVEGTMMIDPETIRNLELVANMAFRKSNHSLFGTLNHTFTAMGARLLRVNIISPITSQEAIDARLDVVEELIQAEELFTELRNALKGLNKADLDKLIISLGSSETVASNTAAVAASRVTSLLNLRTIVGCLPAIVKALEHSKSQLLRIAYEMLCDERLNKIDQLIDASLNKETSTTKNGLAATNARVYAIKANYNRLLDVARETYKENVGDICALNAALVEKHELPFSLIYQDTGFVFSLKKADLQDGQLPPGFINPTLKKGRWNFSSLDLKKMNARMKDALDETLMLSNKIIQELVAQILVDVAALYKASEAIALIDMLWSFAHASMMRNYVRPEFTGTLAVKSGRHPILETVQAVGTLVPNDIYCDDSSSFQIIQGPNMSGKSTYLRQVGLLVVMAMCGCFVPADYASFRIHDALLTRLSNDDDMERSLSTFANEMASSAMILGLASAKSLILVDELGRGTSPRDGVGISHAIAEAMIEQKSFVFFATHFTELSTTLSRRPSVVCLHLSVQKTAKTASSLGLLFQYKILDGAPEDIAHYGLNLARLADLPSDVLSEAKRVATKLAELHAKDKEASESTRINIRRKVLLKLRTQLTQALEHSALPDQELLTYLGRIQTEVTKGLLYSG